MNSNVKMMERSKKQKKKMEMMLPQELQMEILSWLPAESLVSFKLVSKAWHTLVNNPGFIKLHLDRAIAAEKHSLLCDFEGAFYELKAPCYTTATRLVRKGRDTLGWEISLVGSCNGLLCLEKGPFNFYPSTERYCDLIIINPSTRRYRQLPQERPDNPDYYYTIPILEWGYSSVLDDYKVVRFLSSKDPDMSPEVKVYSMSTNSWRRAIDTHYGIHLCRRSTGRFLNEAFHWIDDDRDANRIISFDISVDKFREVPAPPDPDGRSKKLMIMRGCLSMMFFDTSYRSCHRNEIWAMKEYGVQESWTRQLVIITAGYGYSSYHEIFDTTVIYRNNDQLLIMICGRDLYSYDMKKNNKKKSSSTIEVADEYYATFTGLIDKDPEYECNYIGSLVSLKSKVIYAGAEC